MVRRTLLVAVSMTCAALVVTSMTSRYRPSRENPRPWTSISPLYIAPRTSALVSIRTLPSGIVPSTVPVFGLITLTVLESWSAVYTRSFTEIAWAPGNAGAGVTVGGPVGVACDRDPLAGWATVRHTAIITAATTTLVRVGP